MTEQMNEKVHINGKGEKNIPLGILDVNVAKIIRMPDKTNIKNSAFIYLSKVPKETNHTFANSL